MCISQIDSHHQLNIAARMGSRQDLRVGATSRVLLAYASEHIQEEVFNQGPIPSHTDNTITDPAEIRKILERIQHDGYYISCGEVDEGVMAVAAPVRDRTKEVIGALVIAAPESRIRKPETLDSIIRLVTIEAGELSMKLGFSGTNVRSSTERSFT